MLIVSVALGAFIVGSIAAALVLMLKWKDRKVREVERTRRHHGAYVKLADEVYA